MSKMILGDVCAYCPGEGKDGKAAYPRLGIAFIDDTKRISIKLDTLPLPRSSWSGWINIFSRTEKSSSPRSSSNFPEVDDDIPF